MTVDLGVERLVALGLEDTIFPWCWCHQGPISAPPPLGTLGNLTQSRHCGRLRVTLRCPCGTTGSDWCRRSLNAQQHVMSMLSLRVGAPNNEEALIRPVPCANTKTGGLPSGVRDRDSVSYSSANPSACQTNLSRHIFETVSLLTLIPGRSSGTANTLDILRLQLDHGFYAFYATPLLQALTTHFRPIGYKRINVHSGAPAQNLIESMDGMGGIGQLLVF
jgi:hypothetical protein